VGGVLSTCSCHKCLLTCRVVSRFCAEDKYGERTFTIINHVFKLGWKGIPFSTCLFTCQELFYRFSRNSECKRRGLNKLQSHDADKPGVYTSHTMPDAGKIEMKCGIASFSIVPPPPSPPPPKPVPKLDTRYRLQVHQEMERKNSFVECVTPNPTFIFPPS
jgi:hypothetical protein